MTAPPISWLMSLALARPQLISLAAGFTDNESLPVDRTRNLLHDLLSEKKSGQSALQYGTTPGSLDLRRLTAKRVQELDGNIARTAEMYDPERVVMTHGSQQLLYLVTECLCNEGDIVLVEDPTYFVFLGMAQSRALRCRAVQMESDGVSLTRLESILEELKKSGDLPKVKMLYLVSYYQNPSGVTTSYEKKIKALELLHRYERAAGHPIYLLEDAAYRELNFKGESIPSALSAAKCANRVIYTGTYSKPFATGARVGFGFLPEPLRTCVLHAKTNHDFGTSNLLQSLMRRAMQTGDYTEHLSELRARYQSKAAVMLKAMRRHFPSSVQWIEPAGGLYFWVRLPRSVPAGLKSKLFQAALEANVLYVPGELCYANDPKRRKPNYEMRVSFGGATESNIREGIKRLGAVLKDFSCQ